MTFTPFTPFTPFTNFSDRSRCTKEVPPITLKPSLVLWQEAFRAKGAGSHAAVSEALEQCLVNEQSLWFSGDWSLPPSHPRSHPVRSPLKLCWRPRRAASVRTMLLGAPRGQHLSLDSHLAFAVSLKKNHSLRT